MTFLAFLAALSLAVLAFELASALQTTLSIFGGHGRLAGARVENANQPAMRRRSTWEGLLLAVFPARFDVSQVKDAAKVTNLLRRAGYPYDTPGEFYAAAMRMFSIYLAIGGLLAGAMVFLNAPLAAPVLVLIFVFLGLRKPYVRLRMLAKKRAEAMHGNMLIGLATLNSLLSAGMGAQEALRRTASIGGPFCNLLGLLVARMEIEDFGKAIEVVRAHLPDLSDIESELFLRDIEDFFVHNRPLGSGIRALQESMHRSIVEATQSRAALVRQRSGLFGVLAVLGLIFSMISPFLGGFVH